MRLITALGAVASLGFVAASPLPRASTAVGKDATPEGAVSPRALFQRNSGTDAQTTTAITNMAAASHVDATTRSPWSLSKRDTVGLNPLKALSRRAGHMEEGKQVIGSQPEPGESSRAGRSSSSSSPSSSNQPYPEPPSDMQVNWNLNHPDTVRFLQDQTRYHGDTQPFNSPDYFMKTVCGTLRHENCTQGEISMVPHTFGWTAAVTNVKPGFRGSENLNVDYGGSIKLPTTDLVGQQKRREWESRHGISANTHIVDLGKLQQHLLLLDQERRRSGRSLAELQFEAEEGLRNEERQRLKHLREQRLREFLQRGA